MANHKKQDEIFKFIYQSYGIKGERLFERYPEFVVFRHIQNEKWFAVFMLVESEKLGFKSGRQIQILNLKCKPDLAKILRDDSQILLAYHMNKKHWISVNLDSDIKSSVVQDLIKTSFELTKGR
ncbi:MmcQ/YjbR family DNA-binding protein [Campylobacter sp. faydin G-24]|uniref:MmcQ/YjbR family DNA-binding protein n=1 Tax=Campylobacter anatolicus TaxID=2829105 RepID=A0ABS5HG09_9BACT|nr:MmcQ/YjbR family DNA-binding protein [Campylobacter anatolicus]MBR8462411.1 MmcQ/YjbR family DNA-binding protein [Campylobacter anatolicus]MBR8463140.1 MmcQ/YjbR family DNA-binding protein [Campylobacter anatolicus]